MTHAPTWRWQPGRRSGPGSPHRTLKCRPSCGCCWGHGIAPGPGTWACLRPGSPTGGTSCCRQWGDSSRARQVEADAGMLEATGRGSKIMHSWAAPPTGGPIHPLVRAVMAEGEICGGARDTCCRALTAALGQEWLAVWPTWHSPNELGAKSPAMQHQYASAASSLTLSIVLVLV